MLQRLNISLLWPGCVVAHSGLKKPRLILSLGKIQNRAFKPLIHHEQGIVVNVQWPMVMVKQSKGKE
jgi:hypothetical protein